MAGNTSNPCDWEVLKITRNIKISSAVLVTVDIIPAILTILLNIVFMVTLIKTKSLQTPSNVFLGALCATDFLVGVTVQPIFISYQIAVLTNSETHSHRVSVRYSVVGVSGLSFIFASFVTIDRYFAICHPFQYRQKATCKRYIVISVIAGLCYTTIAALMLLQRNYHFEGIVVSYTWLTFIGIIVCYARIYRVAAKKRSAVINMGTINDEETRQARGYEKKERDKTNIIAIILGFILLCYTPFGMMSIAAVIWRNEVCSSREVATITALWVGLFVLINSCINPFIYFVLSGEFVAAAKRIFKGRKEDSEANNNNTRSNTEKTVDR